jgi:hypothetical protein
MIKQIRAASVAATVMALVGCGGAATSYGPGVTPTGVPAPVLTTVPTAGLNDFLLSAPTGQIALSAGDAQHVALTLTHSPAAREAVLADVVHPAGPPNFPSSAVWLVSVVPTSQPDGGPGNPNPKPFTFEVVMLDATSGQLIMIRSG